MNEPQYKLQTLVNNTVNAGSSTNNKYTTLMQIIGKTGSGG